MEVLPQVVQDAHGMLCGQLHDYPRTRVVGEALHKRRQIRHVIGHVMAHHDVGDGGLLCHARPRALNRGHGLARCLDPSTEGPQHRRRGLHPDSELRLKIFSARCVVSETMVLMPA
jgi:hypothetical protein